ncbi:MAG: dihydroorotase [Bacteroidia bacterium]|nr:dihydroorotase [Bacteroidia bacterium]
MPNKTLIKNATLVNEGRVYVADVLVINDIIEQIDTAISAPPNAHIVDAEGLHLLPGVIDDQVHFREPGLTHKGDLFTESRAAVAGGVTSFMEMPNTVPNTLTQVLLQQKYDRAAEVSVANYSFFMGASNNNLDEVLGTDVKNVCGVKVFMGSSTGDMLVDNEQVLEKLFAQSPALIATHCEDELTIRTAIAKCKQQYGENITANMHPIIRSAEACYKSSSMAVALAKKHNTRLHVLHISTAAEVNLFDNNLTLDKKRITAEACIHHLWFTDEDYARLGNLIKWNPAVKTAADRTGIWQGLFDNKIDVIATDHAPHTLDEKQQPYINAPSGGPLIQHSLLAMLEMYHQQKITLPFIADKMSHAVATCFKIKNRGFIRPGFAADLVLADLTKPTHVTNQNVLYKCKWTPFNGNTFNAQIVATMVNGHWAYKNGKINDTIKGQRLQFNS